MRREWTTGDVRKLHEMRSKRIPTRLIAAELGRTPHAVFSFLRYIPACDGQPASMGPTNRLPPAPKPPKLPRARRDNDWTPEEIACLRDMAEDGATIKDAVVTIGRSQNAVQTKASNLQIRFGNSGGHSIYRLEQETNHYRRNAIAGSALLRDAIFNLIHPRNPQAEARESYAPQPRAATLAA